MEYNKCMLPASLAFVWRISRALGLAPVKLENIDGKYRGTLSRRVVIYNCVLSSIIAIVTLYNCFEYVYSRDVFPIGIIAISIHNGIVTGSGSFFAFYRIKRVLKLLVTLQKINYKVGVSINQEYKVSKSIPAHLMWIFIFLVYIEVKLYFTNGLLGSIKALFLFEAIRLLLLIMEKLLVKQEIVHSIEAVNENLLQMIEDLKSGSVTADAIRSNCEHVREIMEFYTSICELVESINKDSGLDMFMLFNSSMASVTTSSINFIHGTFLSSEYSGREIIEQFIWTSYHLSTAIIFIEPCHHITKQIIRLRINLASLIHEMTPVGKTIEFELDLMSKQVILNEPQISPLGIYTLQRPLITKAITFITTYVVIILQNAKN